MSASSCTVQLVAADSDIGTPVDVDGPGSDEGPADWSDCRARTYPAVARLELAPTRHRLSRQTPRPETPARGVRAGCVFGHRQRVAKRCERDGGRGADLAGCGQLEDRGEEGVASGRMVEWPTQGDPAEWED
jgi:hypothetical protein